MPIRPAYVKDIGDELIERYPSAIGTNFEQNKQVVNELTTIESKTVRNRVAGYLTRQQHRPNLPV